jgi:hypothetical protein
MFHVKHPLQFLRSILAPDRNRVGKNFTHTPSLQFHRTSLSEPLFAGAGGSETAKVKFRHKTFARDDNWPSASVCEHDAGVFAALRLARTLRKEL